MDFIKCEIEEPRVKNPDWKREYMKMAQMYAKAHKLAEDFRFIALTMLDEIGKLERERSEQLDRCFDSACKRFTDERNMTTLETEAVEMQSYIAFLESENAELKAQLQAAGWQK